MTLKENGVTASDTDLAWAAGIIDGEGCISLSRSDYRERYPRWSLTVAVANIDPRLVARMRAILGGKVTVRKTKPHPRHRRQYLWQVSTAQAATALRLVLPYLVAKRDQADLALQSRECLGRPSPRIPADAETLLWLKQQLSALKHQNFDEEDDSEKRMAKTKELFAPDQGQQDGKGPLSP